MHQTKNGRWGTQARSSTYLNEAVAIWLRDLRSEFRTRYALNAILMFAVTTLIAVSFSIGSFRIEEAERPFLFSVLLWIILTFSALSGLARSFVKEEEAGTIDVLKLSARPQAVFLGKLFFNLTLLGALELIIVPSFVLLMSYQINSPGFFIAIIISGGLGLGAGTTIIAAMIARASTRGALFSALSLPLLLPLMITCIKGCERAAIGMNNASWPEVKVAVAYFIIMITMSLLLFPLVWEE
ncbi:MAG: heme exporter protein CcmB [Deltaproteobacteria bacterium]|nr:heme exporter protein CcmB [Deltaproteobacteria bacterium]MBW1792828.1 heme exporter protein CcmB [Deltaproteobacteria bacterium]MBW2329640.1 heme exporter protein CcmB [Deltaproteobacteria bacterium]